MSNSDLLLSTIVVICSLVAAGIISLAYTLCLDCISARSAQMLSAAITVGSHSWVAYYFAPDVLGLLAEHGTPDWAPWLAIVLYAFGAVFSYRAMLPFNVTYFRQRSCSAQGRLVDAGPVVKPK